jgi:aryl carrier-like protein
LELPPQGNLLIHNLERIRMRRLYKRFEKLRASYDLTQIVTTIPEFLKD